MRRFLRVPSCPSWFKPLFYFHPVPFTKRLMPSQVHNVEVYKQPDGFTTEFQVRKDLGLMDWGDCPQRT